VSNRPWRRLLLAALSVAVSSCDSSLPEPDSAGAQLYGKRCAGCHRLYAPHLLKFEMWKVTVQRMQGEMVRRGFPPLTTEEQALLLDYLRRFSG
jgi:hypothetical protein